MRLLLYSMLIGLLPFLFVVFNFFSNQSSLNEMRVNLQDMQQTAQIREKKQAANMAIANHYRDADHFYIDKYVETLTFLEPEIESLQKLINNKNFAGDEAVKKRVELLTGPGNAMVFSEGVVQSSPSFQETTETLVHPVEVNVADLQKILARIEGMSIGPFSPGPNRPQLIILDFKLDRKNITEKNEIFVLNLKLLKREHL
jgi:hypothetical protein